MFDRFNRRIHYLRISVTDRCNLACTYCMPEGHVAKLPREDILSFEQIVELTRTAVELGFDKVRLTGGEPLVRKGIVDLVRMLASLGGINDFGMTTNGILLAQYAKPLRDAGLHRLNISCDTLDPQRFSAISRGGRLEDLLAGIDAAQAAGFSRIKLNCVIQESPEEPDARMVADFGAQRGLEVRYIRRMDTAKGSFWRVLGGDGGACQICNRLRVSSDGRIFPCLFSDVHTKVSELGPRQAILSALAIKPESGRHSDNKFYRLGG